MSERQDVGPEGGQKATEINQIQKNVPTALGPGTVSGIRQRR